MQRGRGEEQKGRLYRLRYALLKSPENWAEEERLGPTGLLEQFPEVKRVWELKEGCEPGDMLHVLNAAT